MVKGADGTISVQDKKEMKPKKGRLLGAITGGLIGLVGRPVGVAVGALTGVVTGGLAAKWIDMGFSDEFLAGLYSFLQPGSSALIVLVEHHRAQPMLESMADLGGVVFQQTLTDELAEELLAANQAQE